MDNQAFFKKHIAQTTPFPLGLEISHAKGSYIYDKSGKAYLDFVSGIAVSNMGHSNDKVNEALKTQIDKHTFVMVYGEYVLQPQIDLTKELLNYLPVNLDCIYYKSTGTEAIEGALKLAKRYTGRSKIVAFKKAYHGSTHGSLSVSGNEQKKYAFRPLLPDVHHIPFNDHSVLKIIDNKTACVIIETIQGDAGIRIPDTEYMKALRDRCNETGALLICDEIQVGMGRTGRMFAFEHFGIEPDILVLGKALGGGLPLGAFIANHSLMHTLTYDPPLGHITTFGGNPLSCTAAFATLQLMKEEDVLANVERKGQLLMPYFNHKLIKEVRRMGLLFAIEFDNKDYVEQIVKFCLAEGLICFWFLSCPEAFRIAPPLNTSDEDLHKAGNIMKAAFDSLKS